MTKVLIIRFSSIGDIILTSPVIRMLKKQVPDIEIHALTKQRHAFLYEQNPYISKTFSFKNKLRESIGSLKKEKYDYVIDLHKNLRSLHAKTSIRRPSVSFPKLNLKKWILVNFKKDLLPDIHIVDRYLMPAKKLFKLNNDDDGLDYFIPEIDIKKTEALLSNTDKNYIVMVLGGKFATKKIPLDVIIAIMEKSNCSFAILGGAEDHNRAEMLLKHFRGTQKIAYNGCGKLNLNQSAYVIKNSMAVITADTGLMHIAAAFNKILISLWGNTVPKFGMYPYLPKMPKNNYIFEVENLSCRPCSKIGYQRCPQRHFKCMLAQDIEKIVETIKENISC